MYLGNTAILIELNDAVSFLDCFPIGQFIREIISLKFIRLLRVVFSFQQLRE